MSTNGARQRGVTLIELIAFIVIIGVALAALVQVLNLTSKASADPVRRKQALMIAEGLLEEVRLAAFTYCDPSEDLPEPPPVNSAACTIPEAFGQSGAEPVGQRPFDNVNDYADAPGTAKAAFDVGGKLYDAAGNEINKPGMNSGDPGYYSARVTIRPAELNGIGNAADPTANTEVLRITVAVKYDNDTLMLDAYRTRYAPHSP